MANRIRRKINVNSLIPLLSHQLLAVRTVHVVAQNSHLNDSSPITLTTPIEYLWISLLYWLRVNCNCDPHCFKTNINISENFMTMIKVRWHHFYHTTLYTRFITECGCDTAIVNSQFDWRLADKRNSDGFA